MSKKNPIKPEHYIEYTFIFGNNVKYTFRFVEYNADGKIILFNVTTKRYAKPLTVRRFDYLMTYQLVDKRHVAQTVEAKLGIKMDDLDARNFRRLNCLSRKEKLSFYNYFGQTVKCVEELYFNAIKSNNTLVINKMRELLNKASLEKII